MKKFALTFVTVVLAFLVAGAQDQGPGPMRMPGDGMVGKVTTVGKDSLTIVPLRGGDPVVIKVGDDTRISKDRQPVKISDIKVDDVIFARVKLDGNTLQAGMVRVVNPEMVQRMQQGGQGLNFGGRFKPEDWGKTFVAGRVKGINETTLTIARQDNQQTLNVEVDENTSFKRGRESITLADIKQDDFVFGQGELKNGVFVIKELRVGGRQFSGQSGGPAPDAHKPDSEKPATPPMN
jgi:hypothetical protein